MKKLVGRTDMEDSLKRLDKLTQEEVRMATAQVLKVTHTIDEGVRGVADKVVGVDDRVANVNDKVTGVDQIVRTVDNKVMAVIEGAQNIIRLVSNKLLIRYWPDVNEAMAVTQQAANDVDEMKRWSSRNCIDYRCAGLNHSYREPITTGPPKVALPARSLDEPQHCV